MNHSRMWVYCGPVYFIRYYIRMLQKKTGSNQIYCLHATFSYQPITCLRQSTYLHMLQYQGYQLRNSTPANNATVNKLIQFQYCSRQPAASSCMYLIQSIKHISRWARIFHIVYYIVVVTMCAYGFYNIVSCLSLRNALRPKQQRNNNRQ